MPEDKKPVPPSPSQYFGNSNTSEKPAPPPPAEYFKKKEELTSSTGLSVGGSAPPSTGFEWSPNKTTNDIVRTEVSVGPTPEPDKTKLPAYQEQEKQRKKEEYFTGLAARYLEQVPSLAEMTPSQLEKLKKNASLLGIEPSYIDDAINGVKSVQSLKKAEELVAERKKTVEQDLKNGKGEFDVIGTGPFVKTAGTAPIEVTPEIVKAKLEKDAEYYAKQQFPQYDELFKISADIKNLQAQEKLTADQQVQLKNLLDNYYSISETEMLFDPKTGQLVDEPNEDTKKYQSDVFSLSQGYQQTPMDKMGDLFLQKKEMLQLRENEYFKNSGKGFTQQQLYAMGMNPDAFAVSGIEPEGGLFYISPEQALTLGIEADDLNVYKKNYIDAKKDFDAITQAYLLNLDPGKADMGYLSYFESGVREGLSNSSIIGGIADLAGFDPAKMTDVQRLETYANNASQAKINLTEKQKEEAEQDLGETVIRATGNSLPIMGDIAIVSAISRGAGGATGLTGAFKSMMDAATNKYGKIVGGALDIMGTGLVTAAEFEMAGAGGATGAGEGTAQGILSKLNVLEKINGKYGTLIKTLVRTGAGGVGETFGEYAGEFANALESNGFDWDKVIDDTFGKDLDEATKKGLATLITSMLFSGASNASVLLAGKEWLADKNIPNKEELIVDIDKKIAEDEATATEQPPVEQPPVEVVPTSTEEVQVEVTPTQTDITAVTEPIQTETAVTEPVKAPTAAIKPKTPTGPIAIGKFEYRNTGDGFELVNTETGNAADPKTVNKNKDKIIELAAPEWEGSKSVEWEMDGRSYVEDVADNSENPFQISEAYIISEELPFDLDYKKEAIADALDGIAIDLESFVAFSDRNLLEDMKGYKFGKSIGNTGELDIIAEAASNVSGMDITPQDIVDFMRENPSVKEFRATSKNPFSRPLQQKFKKLTGMPLNAETAMKMQQKQAEMLGVKEAEMEALYNQSESQDYETTKREFEQYLESDPAAAERFFGAQTEVDITNDTGDGGNQEDISIKTISEIGKDWADNIRRLKIDGDIAGSFIIPPQLWNGAIEAVALSFEGGAKIVDAIAKGAKYIRTQLEKEDVAEEEIKKYEAEFVQRANPITRRPSKKDSSEMASIKKELRDRLNAFRRGMKKGASQGKKTVKEAQKEFSEGIKEAIKPLTSRLNPSQIKALVNRAAKVSTEKQLERFQEYAEKVISDANYANNLEAVQKLIKAVRSKVKGRYSAKLKEIARLDLSELLPEEVAELAAVLKALNQRVPDTTPLLEYFIPYYGKKEKTIKTTEEFSEALKNAITLEIGDLAEIRKSSIAINALQRDLNLMLSEGLILQEEYEMALTELDESQEWLSSMLGEEAKFLKEAQLPNIKSGLSKWDKTNFTEPENTFLAELRTLTDEEIMALPLSDVEALSDIADRIQDGFVPLRQATDIYNKAKGKSQGLKIAEQVNAAMSINSIPNNLEKAKIKLAQVEIQKVEDMLGIGRGSAVFKFIYNPISKALAKAKISDVELWKQYLNAANTGVTSIISKVTSLPLIGNTIDKISGGQKKRDVSKSKVAMKRYSQMVSNMEGYANGMEIASMDWFGLLLGEESAYNAIRFNEDVTNKEERLSRLKKEMKSQAGDYNTQAQGKINKRSQLDIMAEVYKTIPRKPDGTADWENVRLTAKEQQIYDAVDDIINKQKDKLMFSNESKGLPWEELPYYLPTLRLSKKGAEIENKPGRMKQKIRSGSSYERTDFSPGAININLDALMSRIINDTNTDYYISSALGTVNRSKSYASGFLQNDMGRDNSIVRNVISNDIEKRIEFNNSGGENYPIIRNFTNAMYIAKLGDPIMRSIDALSSYLKIPFYTGSTKSLYYAFDKGKRDVYSKLIKDTGSSLDIKVSKVTEPSVTGTSPEQTPTGKGTQFILGFDDWLNPVAQWLPTFEFEFLDLTGENFDAKSYMEDPNYYKENKALIDEAASFADRETKRLYGGSTKFDQRMLVKILPKLEGLKADTFWGKMASILSIFSYREQGEFFSNIQAIWNNENRNRTTGASRAFGSLLQGTVFGLLGTTWFLTKASQLGDEEEKKKAKMALDELLTTKGVLKETASGLAFLGMSRYGQVGRYNALVSLSFVHEFTKDKQEKEQIKKFIKDNLFTTPIEFTPKGFWSSALSSAIPPLAYSFSNMMKVVNGGSGWKESPDGIKKLIEKYEKEGFEGLTKDEQDRWTLFSQAMHMLSFVGAFGGYSVPGKATIEKAVQQQIKEADKNK